MEIINWLDCHLFECLKWVLVVVVSVLTGLLIFMFKGMG